MTTWFCSAESRQDHVAAEANVSAANVKRAVASGGSHNSTIVSFDTRTRLTYTSRHEPNGRSHEPGRPRQEHSREPAGRVAQDCGGDCDDPVDLHGLRADPGGDRAHCGGHHHRRSGVCLCDRGLPDRARDDLRAGAHCRRARALLRRPEGFRRFAQARRLFVHGGLDRRRVPSHPVSGRNHRAHRARLHVLPVLPGRAAC